MERMSPASTIMLYTASLPARYAPGRDSFIIGESMTGKEAISRPTALIVEDEPLIAVDLADSVSRFGYDVASIARTAGQALAAAEGHTPALAIVDVHLADGSSGLDVVRALAPRGTVCIVVSLESGGEDALAAGALCFLPKPFAADALRMAIESAARTRDRADGHRMNRSPSSIAR